MKKKILIIDDDGDFVRSLRMVLEPSGYAVTEADSAKSGLAKAKREKPDLIILDVMMESETAGFHLAYELKGAGPGKASAGAGVPILMLTSIGSVKGVSFNKETDGGFLPVEEFLEKPVRPDLLLKTVERLLSAAGPEGGPDGKE